MSKPKTGAQLITAERKRQITKELWCEDHDDTHGEGELAYAARCYALPNISEKTNPPMDWPWQDDDWKPKDDPIRNLVRAGALIAAEIDRLQRGLKVVSK